MSDVYVRIPASTLDASEDEGEGCSGLITDVSDITDVLTDYCDPSPSKRVLCISWGAS